MVFQSLFIFLFFFSRVSQIARLEVGARLVLSRIQSAAPSQQSEDKNDKKKRDEGATKLKKVLRYDTFNQNCNKNFIRSSIRKTMNVAGEFRSFSNFGNLRTRILKIIKR